MPGFDPGLAVPGFDPGFEVPGFVELPFGAIPGFDGFSGVVPEFGLFGFVAFGSVGFDPGVVLLGVDAPPVGGCAVLPVGGCPVLPVGGAEGDVWPGCAWPEPACPGLAEPPGAAPPAGAACAATQVAHPKTTESKANFLADIMRPPPLNLGLTL